MDAMDHLSSAERRLTIRTRLQSGAIEIGVSDNGRGIPAECLPRLFDPFYTTRQNGLGLGLSIARTIWVALRYRPARMHLELDGERVVRTRALMAVIANGPYTGAGMTVAPDARIDDGRFDVRVFRGFSKAELLRHLASIAFGRYRYAPHVSTFHAAAVRVTSAHPLPTRADSHDLGTTPLDVRMRSRVLRVIGPEQPVP